MEEDFTPVQFEEPPRGLFEAPLEPSIHTIEVVDSSGEIRVYPVGYVYCPKYTDVCETLRDQEPPGDSLGYFDPSFIVITPDTQEINFKVKGRLVKHLTCPPQEPKARDITVETTDESQWLVRWTLEKQDTEAWIVLAYRGRDKCESILFGNWSATNIPLSPDSIYSPQDEVDVRLLVTDGFHLHTLTKERLLKFDTPRKIKIWLNGLPRNATPGQTAHARYYFIDPETASVCNAKSCPLAEDPEKYHVTWFSDQQPICASDLYKGELQYVFKKEGTHRLGITVQHRTRPELHAEAYQDVIVSPGEGSFQPRNPECSFY